VADVDIYELIAAAIAEGRAPDLSVGEASQVRAALALVLQRESSRQQFLARLDARVQQLTGGRISLEERPADDQLMDSPSDDPLAVLAVRLVVQGEPFAEPANVRSESPIVEFPMRGPA
jgi:hypothetical protein